MCETPCVNGRHAKNMLNIKISRHILVLPLPLECSGEISRQSVESGKVRKQPVPRLEIITPDKTASNGTSGPPSVCDNRSRFPGESTALQHVFLSRDVDAIDWQRRERQRQNPCQKGQRRKMCAAKKTRCYYLRTAYM